MANRVNSYNSIKSLFSLILDKIAKDKNITDECNSVFAKLSYDESNLTAEHYFGQNKKYSNFEEIMEKMFYDEPGSKNDYNNYSILRKDTTIKRNNIEKIQTEKDKYYRLCSANYLELILLTIENIFINKQKSKDKHQKISDYLKDILTTSFENISKKYDETDKEIAKNFILSLTTNTSFCGIYSDIKFSRDQKTLTSSFENIKEIIKNFRSLLEIKPSMDRFFDYLNKTKIRNDYNADKIKKDIINNNLKKYNINENNKIGLNLKTNELNIQKIKLALPKINKLLEYLGEDSLNSEAIELEKKFNLINKIKSLLKAKELDLDALKSINDTLINLYKHELETILDYTSDIFYNKDLEAIINKKQIEVKNESLINEDVLKLCYHLPDRELLNTIKVYISTIEVIRDVILEIKKSLTEKLDYLENEEYLLRSKFLKKIYNNFMELVSKETIFSSEKTEKTEDENRKLLVLTLDKIFKNLTFEVFITEGLTKKLIEKYIIKNKLYFTDNGIKKLDKLKSEYDKLILKIEFLKAGYSDNYKSLLKQSNLRLALKGISIFGLNVGVSLFEGTRFDAKKAIAADELKSKMDELRPIFQKARPSLDLDSEEGQKLLRTFAKKELDKDNKLGLWNIVRLVNPFSSSSRSLGRENIKSWWSKKASSSSTAHTITQTFTAFGALASALKNIATLDAKSFTKNIWKATTSIFSAIFLPPENVRQKMREMKDEAKRTKKKQKEELKKIKRAKKFLDGSLGKEESNFSDLTITEATKNVFSTTADKFADFFSDNEDSNLSGNEKSGIISSIKNIFGMFSSKAAEQIKKDLSVTDKSESNNSNTSNSKPKKGISGNLKDLMLTSKLSWFATMSSKLFDAGVETASGNSKEDKEFKKETLGFGRTITDYLRKFWDSYSKKETRKAPTFADKKDNNIYIGNSETLNNPEVKNKEPWWKKLLGLLPFMLPFLGKLLSSILGFFGIDSKKVFRFLRFLFKFSWGIIKTSFKILKWIGKHCWKALKWFFTDGLKKIKWLFSSIAEVSGKIIRFLGLDKLLNAIINFFKNPIKSVGDIFGKLLKGSAGFLSSLKNFVIDIVGGAIKLFVDGLVKVGVLSGEIAKSVIKGLGIKSLNKSFLNSELQASEEAVKSATKNAKKLDFTKTKDLSLGEKILATLNKIIDTIGGFLKGAFDLLAKMWSIAIDFIKNPSWDSFKKAGVEIIKAVKGSFTDALSYLKEAYNNFKGVTANFIKTCIENARNTYEAVKNKAAQCWNTFKVLANPKALFSKLMSFVRLLLSPSSVKGAFKAMKAIPLVNVIASAGFALYYLSQGKWVAAVCEIIAVLITVFSGGIACAVSIALSLSSEKIQEVYDDWVKKADDKTKVYAAGDENKKNFTKIAEEGESESSNFQDDLNNITPEKILDLFKTVDVNDIQTSDTVLNDIYGSDYSSLSDENIKQKVADKNNFDSSGLGKSSDSKTDFVSNTVKNITNNTIDYNNINNINASVTNVDFGFDTGDNPYKITKIGNDNAYVFGKPEGSNVAAYSFRKQGVVIENPDGTYEVRTGGTKAWRNNNPGNIRFSKWMWRNTKPIGVDYNGFLIYRTQDEGQRAIGFLLKNSGKYKDKTIPNAIETYAPRNENNTDAYIRHVKRAFLSANLGDVESRTISSLNRMEMDLLVSAIKSKEGNMAGSVKISTKENLSSDISSSYNEVANTYTNKAPSYSTPSTSGGSSNISGSSGSGSVSATGKSGDVLTNKAPQNQVSEANILTTQALIEKQKELVKTISELKADLDLVKKDNQTGDFKLFNSFISWYEM